MSRNALKKFVGGLENVYLYLCMIFLKKKKRKEKCCHISFFIEFLEFVNFQIKKKNNVKIYSLNFHSRLFEVDI